PHVRRVVASHRRVMGDGPLGLHDRLAGGRLDGAPLLELRPRSATRQAGEVERGAVPVGVREVAYDDPGGALRRQRGTDRPPYGVVELAQAAPGVGGLEGFGQVAEIEQLVA